MTQSSEAPREPRSSPLTLEPAEVNPKNWVGAIKFLPPHFYELCPFCLFWIVINIQEVKELGKKGRVLTSHCLKPDVLCKATYNKKQSIEDQPEKCIHHSLLHILGQVACWCLLDWVSAFHPPLGVSTIVKISNLPHRTGKEGNAPK